MQQIAKNKGMENNVFFVNSTSQTKYSVSHLASLTKWHIDSKQS